MWFSKKTEPQVQAQIVTQGPVINPESGDLRFAEYRADAIARCIEQRRDEGMPLHHEHPLLFSEAMAYAYRLMGCGAWTQEKFDAFRKRLEG